MNIIEQDKTALEILDQYFQTYKINPIYIPQDAFILKGIDKGDIKLILIRLEGKSMIGKWEHASGGYSKTTDSEFKETGTRWEFFYPNHFMFSGDNEEEEKMMIESTIKPYYKVSFNPEKITKKSEKYSDIKENIELKPLDIKIEGDFIIYKKEKSKKINFTDKQLINFLFLRFNDDKQLCFKKEFLAKEFETSAGNVKNRISFINQEIRKLIVKGKTNIDDFIKYEGVRRGYHLNPRFMIQFIKKEKN